MCCGVPVQGARWGGRSADDPEDTEGQPMALITVSASGAEEAGFWPL